MKFYLEGDKGKALCEHCRKLVSTTYVRRSVPFSDGKGEAKDILVAACDTCGQVVSIPAQSTPAIKVARGRDTTPIEARLPAVYLDMLDQAMYTITSDASAQHRRLFLAYFFHKLAPVVEAAQVLQRVHEHVIVTLFDQRAIGNSQKRLSMKVNPSMADDLEQLMSRTHMSQTELLKSTICQIHEDVVFTPNAAVINELKQLAKVAL
ncbi:hypothetical protein [Azotobacter salinestris]|uniref:hypothetical protein n=1 Tax=Azotobacter salinestris TaxID=69964 RepID=UPI0032DEA595